MAMKIPRPCAKCHRKLTTKMYCDDCLKRKEKQNYQQRNKDWQYLYGSRWQRLRTMFLAEHPLCENCLIEGKTTRANEVHHMRAHRGNNAIFWDSTNWQALCKSCHSKETAKEKKG